MTAPGNQRGPPVSNQAFFRRTDDARWCAEVAIVREDREYMEGEYGTPVQARPSRCSWLFDGITCIKAAWPSAVHGDVAEAQSGGALRLLTPLVYLAMRWTEA